MLMMPHSILVVDDHPLNLKLLTLILESEGYTVLHAGDAESALRALEAEVPSLILMDVQLPGMNGLELSILLKADPRYSKIPIIAVTAYAMEKDREAALAAGCEGYLSKPIDVEALPGIIHDFVR